MKKILVIRFSSIGDIVLTSPVIRCLKEQVEHAEIHFLVKKQFIPVVEANPHIRKIWVYDRNFRELLPLLRKEHFHFIVDLHKNYRSHYVKLCLLKKSGTFPKINIRKWMAVNFRMDVLPPVHLVDRYFQAVKKLRVRNDGKGLDYFIPPAEEVDVSSVFPGISDDYTTVVIGGKHTTKIFPAERTAELCKRIPKAIILLGGPEDAERGKWIAANSGAHVFNACGALTLNQSVSVVRQAAYIITNDTGLMHIAAAFQKPVTSVWGNTIPGFGMYPYLPQGKESLSHIAEVKGLSCRPCSKIGFHKCPKKHFRCMMEINLDEIIRRI